MLDRALVDDLDEVVVEQHGAQRQDGEGHLDVVVGQDLGQHVRHVVKFRELFADDAPEGHFDVVHEMVQDVEHDRALALGERRIVILEHPGDGLGEGLAPLGRLVARQLKEIDALNSSHGGRPASLTGAGARRCACALRLAPLPGRFQPRCYHPTPGAAISKCVREAGYEAGSSRQHGHQLLKVPSIAARIAAIRQRMAEDGCRETGVFVSAMVIYYHGRRVEAPHPWLLP